jgi:2'-5' RNA ligase
MLAVIAIPDFDAAAAAWLAAIRAAHDPLQDRVGPHVTLAFPRAIADQAAFAAELAAAAAATPAFAAAFDRLERMADPFQPKYAHLNVLLADAASAPQFAALHRRLGHALADYRPHLTVARFGAVYCAKALQRQIGASFGPPLSGRVTALELLRLEHGAIRPAAKFELAA